MDFSDKKPDKKMPARKKLIIVITILGVFLFFLSVFILSPKVRKKTELNLSSGQNTSQSQSTNLGEIMNLAEVGPLENFNTADTSKSQFGFLSQIWKGITNYIDHGTTEDRKTEEQMLKESQDRANEIAKNRWNNYYQEIIDYNKKAAADAEEQLKGLSSDQSKEADDKRSALEEIKTNALKNIQDSENKIKETNEIYGGSAETTPTQPTSTPPSDIAEGISAGLTDSSGKASSLVYNPAEEQAQQQAVLAGKQDALLSEFEKSLSGKNSNLRDAYENYRQFLQANPDALDGTLKTVNSEGAETFNNFKKAATDAGFSEDNALNIMTAVDGQIQRQQASQKEYSDVVKQFETRLAEGEIGGIRGADLEKLKNSFQEYQKSTDDLIQSDVMSKSLAETPTAEEAAAMTKQFENRQKFIDTAEEVGLGENIVNGVTSSIDAKIIPDISPDRNFLGQTAGGKPEDSAGQSGEEPWPAAPAAESGPTADPMSWNQPAEAGSQQGASSPYVNNSGELVVPYGNQIPDGRTPDGSQVAKNMYGTTYIPSDKFTALGTDEEGRTTYRLDNGTILRSDGSSQYTDKLPYVDQDGSLVVPGGAHYLGNDLPPGAQAIAGDPDKSIRIPQGQYEAKTNEYGTSYTLKDNTLVTGNGDILTPKGAPAAAIPNKIGLEMDEIGNPKVIREPDLSGDNDVTPKENVPPVEIPNLQDSANIFQRIRAEGDNILDTIGLKNLIDEFLVQQGSVEETTDFTRKDASQGDAVLAPGDKGYITSEGLASSQNNTENSITEGIFSNSKSTDTTLGIWDKWNEGVITDNGTVDKPSLTLDAEYQANLEKARAQSMTAAAEGNTMTDASPSPAGSKPAASLPEDTALSATTAAEDASGAADTVNDIPYQANQSLSQDMQGEIELLAKKEDRLAGLKEAENNEYSSLYGPFENSPLGFAGVKFAYDAAAQLGLNTDPVSKYFGEEIDPSRQMGAKEQANWIGKHINDLQGDLSSTRAEMKDLEDSIAQQKADLADRGYSPEDIESMLQTERDNNSDLKNPADYPERDAWGDAIKQGILDTISSVPTVNDVLKYVSTEDSASQPQKTEQAQTDEQKTSPDSAASSETPAPANTTEAPAGTPENNQEEPAAPQYADLPKSDSTSENNPDSSSYNGDRSAETEYAKGETGENGGAIDMQGNISSGPVSTQQEDRVIDPTGPSIPVPIPNAANPNTNSLNKEDTVVEPENTAPVPIPNSENPEPSYFRNTAQGDNVIDSNNPDYIRSKEGLDQRNAAEQDKPQPGMSIQPDEEGTLWFNEINADGTHWSYNLEAASPEARNNILDRYQQWQREQREMEQGRESSEQLPASDLQDAQDDIRSYGPSDANWDDWDEGRSGQNPEDYSNEVDQGPTILPDASSSGDRSQEIKEPSGNEPDMRLMGPENAGEDFNNVPAAQEGAPSSGNLSNQSTTDLSPNGKAVESNTVPTESNQTNAESVNETAAQAQQGDWVDQTIASLKESINEKMEWLGLDPIFATDQSLQNNPTGNNTSSSNNPGETTESSGDRGENTMPDSGFNFSDGEDQTLELEQDNSGETGLSKEALEALGYSEEDFGNGDNNQNDNEQNDNESKDTQKGSSTNDANKTNSDSYFGW